MNTTPHLRDALAAACLVLALGGVYWFDSIRTPEPRNYAQGVSGENRDMVGGDGEAANRSPSLVGVDRPANSNVEAAPTQAPRNLKTNAHPPLKAPPKIVHSVKKAPYTKFKGQNIVDEAEKDEFGNPEGTDYDLALDGAFTGLTIAVLHLYTGGGFDFRLPLVALREKGFAVHRWANQPPSASELERVLRDACQLWIISDQRKKLGSDHLAVIRAFFESGRGVYIWGDNKPYYADANYVADELFGGSMSGDRIGDQVVHLRTGERGGGMVPNHLITTGLENLYEGITIATVEKNHDLRPLVYGSAGNLVVATYDSGGKRAILDGGFTRLYHKWNTAGTGRYVKNAAAWLVNYERFGRSVFFSFELSQCVSRLRGATQEEIVGALRSTDFVERIGAIVTVQERRLPLFQELIALLRDDVKDVRQEARTALVELAQGPDYGPVEDAAEAGQAEIERSVAGWSKWNLWRQHLGEFSSLPDNQLVALLDESDAVKIWAAVSAVRNRALRIPAQLINLLRHQDADVCEETRLALVALSDHEYDFGPPYGGLPAARAEAFARWTKWWQREQMIPGLQPLDLDKLLDRLKSPDAIERWAAAAVVRRRSLKVHEELLVLVRDEDNEVRQEARRALVGLAREQDFGPPDRAGEAEIVKAASAWDAWWAEEKARIEAIAQNRLQLAKNILERNSDKGRLRLENVIREYPDTEAAEEAKRMLAGQSPAVKEDAPPVDEREREALEKLNQAKKRLANSPALLRVTLADIVRDYPDTLAAKEAEQLLMKE